MAIMISDIDMPQSCVDCPLCEHEIDDSGYPCNYWCSITDKTMDINIYMDSRRYDCPLKEVDNSVLEGIRNEIAHSEIEGLWKPGYKEGFNDGIAKSCSVIDSHLIREDIQ